MKYKFRLVLDQTTLAFANSEETLERIRYVLDLPAAEIKSTKQGPKQIIWAGSRTPIEIGGKRD